MAKNKVIVTTYKVTDLRNEYYQGIDPRRRIDYRNGMLVGKDYNAFANCPPYGYQTYFPDSPGTDKSGRRSY